MLSNYTICSNENFLLFFSFQCLGNLCMPMNNNNQFKDTFNQRRHKNFEHEGNRNFFKKKNGTRARRRNGRPRG